MSHGLNLGVHVSGGGAHRCFVCFGRFGHIFTRSYRLRKTLGLDRHSRPQAMVLVLSGIEIDTDGNALHHFHVVARGIFRRQKAETRAAGASDPGDAPVVFVIVRIHRERHLLARFHALELRLFEIGGDPDVLQGNEGHDAFAGRNVLANLAGLFAYDSVSGRANDGVAKVQLGLIERGALLRDPAAATFVLASVWVIC